MKSKQFIKELDNISQTQWKNIFNQLKEIDSHKLLWELKFC